MSLDYQILLLPRLDYWAWLQACREYVMRFGANLTPDPGAAGRYMSPTQVITLPFFDGAYPELGDPIPWFRKNHSGVRLDPIEADSPQALGEVLRGRVEENDRYGALRRPFHLLWPTDFPALTQAFGANPQIYRRYGMPGHEGVDLRALTNTNVYACADGEVYEVYNHPKSHAYGIHVRIQHRDGYKTVYAHLAKALVHKGDPVQAGQLIARADSTGNSSAPHLHLSLKRDGATARQETTYPKDIIDPTPFLVWPGRVVNKGIDSVRRGPRTGLHLVRAGGLLPRDIEAAAASAAQVVMISHLETRETIEGLRSALPSLRLIARVSEAPVSDGLRPAHFVARTAGEIGRLYRMGVMDFELLAYPNEHGGGLGRMWKDGEAFAEWFCEAVRRLREVFPQGRFGFPTLADGTDVTGRQQDPLSFVGGAEKAVRESDWLGLACPPNLEHRMLANTLRDFPGKPIVITELDGETPQASPEAMAIRCVAFVDGLRDSAVEAVLCRGLETIAPGAEATEYSWEALKILSEG